MVVMERLKKYSARVLSLLTYLVRKKLHWIFVLLVLSSVLWFCVLRQPINVIGGHKVLNEPYDRKNRSMQIDNNPIREQLAQDELIILYWTKFFYGYTELFGRGRTVLDERRSCRYTMDRAEVNSSKFVIYSAQDFKPSELLRYHPPDQLWVYAIWESPLMYWADDTKNFEKVQKRTFFNLSISYRLDSDFYEPYGSCRPLLDREPNASPSLARGGKIAAGKTKLIAWFVSNCVTASHRERYVASMSSHIQVDTYGRCGKLSCKPDECINLLNTTYKFYLSFENANCPDYVSEKLFKILGPQINIIPVVRGGANYSRILPPHSYLDVRDFSTVKELTDYMKFLDEHDDEYEKYFAWRKTHVCQCYIGTGSDICRRAHELRHVQNRVLNVNNFWRRNDCRTAK